MKAMAVVHAWKSKLVVSETGVVLLAIYSDGIMMEM